MDITNDNTIVDEEIELYPTENIAQETVVQPIIEPGDRHSHASEYVNEHEYTEEDDKTKAVMLPTTLYDKLDKLLDAINGMSEEKFKGLYSKKEITATGINLQSVGTTIEKDIFVRKLNDEPENWVNDVKFGDKSLTISNVPINSTGKLTGSAAVAKFSSKLGIGEHVMVPLWHSGFWVTIRPPKDSDIINLEIALAENEIRLGRETATLIYSNYSVIYTRIIVDFIVSHIINTSVKLPADVDIKDIIMVQDLYPLMLGMLSAMNPEGYSIIRNCVNTAVLVNDKPICDYTVASEVKPIKLLKVDKKILSEEAKTHMSVRRPDSKTIDQIRDYQIKLNVDLIKVIDLTTSNNSLVRMTLKAPTLATYIDNGEEWIETIINNAQELFTDSDTKELKNGKIRDTLSAVVLGIYNVYVTKIELDDTVVDERADVNAILDMLSGDERVMTEYTAGVRNYISDNVVAIAATANFTCPNCLAKEREADQNASKKGPFKEFIPINMLEHFFDLSVLKTSKIRARNIS